MTVGGVYQQQGQQQAHAMSNNDEVAHNLNTEIDNYTGLTHSHHPENMLAHTPKQQLPSRWILLDNGSMVELIPDWSLLEDIHEVENQVPIHCNAGTVRIHQQGYLGSYLRPMWYHPNGIANIHVAVPCLPTLSCHYGQQHIQFYNFTLKGWEEHHVYSI